MQGQIYINPEVVNDQRDALAVAYNEAYRIIMEQQGFEPKAEPTPEQVQFFSDTAYANDPLMMKRTITARIATYDGSVPNPTPEQYQDVVDMLNMVMESGVIQNDEEEGIVTSTLQDMEAKVQESQGEAPAAQALPGEEAMPPEAMPPEGLPLGAEGAMPPEAMGLEQLGPGSQGPGMEQLEPEMSEDELAELMMGGAGTQAAVKAGKVEDDEAIVANAVKSGYGGSEDLVRDYVDAVKNRRNQDELFKGNWRTDTTYARGKVDRARRALDEASKESYDADMAMFSELEKKGQVAEADAIAARYLMENGYGGQEAQAYDHAAALRNLRAQQKNLADGQWGAPVTSANRGANRTRAALRTAAKEQYDQDMAMLDEYTARAERIEASPDNVSVTGTDPAFGGSPAGLAREAYTKTVVVPRMERLKNRDKDRRATSNPEVLASDESLNKQLALLNETYDRAQMAGDQDMMTSAATKAAQIQGLLKERAAARGTPLTAEDTAAADAYVNRLMAGEGAAEAEMEAADEEYIKELNTENSTADLAQRSNLGRLERLQDEASERAKAGAPSLGESDAEVRAAAAVMLDESEVAGLQAELDSGAWAQKERLRELEHSQRETSQNLARGARGELEVREAEQAEREERMARAERDSRIAARRDKLAQKFGNSALDTLSSLEQPATEQHATEQHATEQPATEQPATEQPAPRVINGKTLDQRIAEIDNMKVSDAVKEGLKAAANAEYGTSDADRERLSGMDYRTKTQIEVSPDGTVSNAPALAGGSWRTTGGTINGHQLRAMTQTQREHALAVSVDRRRQLDKFFKHPSMAGIKLKGTTGAERQAALDAYAKAGAARLSDPSRLANAKAAYAELSSLPGSMMSEGDKLRLETLRQAIQMAEANAPKAAATATNQPAATATNQPAATATNQPAATATNQPAATIKNVTVEKDEKSGATVVTTGDGRKVTIPPGSEIPEELRDEVGTVEEWEELKKQIETTPRRIAQDVADAAETAHEWNVDRRLSEGFAKLVGSETARSGWFNKTVAELNKAVKANGGDVDNVTTRDFFRFVATKAAKGEDVGGLVKLIEGNDDVAKGVLTMLQEAGTELPKEALDFLGGEGKAIKNARKDVHKMLKGLFSDKESMTALREVLESKAARNAGNSERLVLKKYLDTVIDGDPVSTHASNAKKAARAEVLNEIFKGAELLEDADPDEIAKLEETVSDATKALLKANPPAKRLTTMFSDDFIKAYNKGEAINVGDWLASKGIVNVDDTAKKAMQEVADHAVKLLEGRRAAKVSTNTLDNVYDATRAAATGLGKKLVAGFTALGDSKVGVGFGKTLNFLGHVADAANTVGATWNAVVTANDIAKAERELEDYLKQEGASKDSPQYKLAQANLAAMRVVMHTEALRAGVHGANTALGFAKLNPIGILASITVDELADTIAEYKQAAAQGRATLAQAEVLQEITEQRMKDVTANYDKLYKWASSGDAEQSFEQLPPDAQLAIVGMVSGDGAAKRIRTLVSSLGSEKNEKKIAAINAELSAIFANFDAAIQGHSNVSLQDLVRRKMDGMQDEAEKQAARYTKERLAEQESVAAGYKRYATKEELDKGSPRLVNTKPTRRQQFARAILPDTSENVSWYNPVYWVTAGGWNENADNIRQSRDMIRSQGRLQSDIFYVNNLRKLAGYEDIYAE